MSANAPDSSAAAGAGPPPAARSGAGRRVGGLDGPPSIPDHSRTVKNTRIAVPAPAAGGAPPRRRRPCRRPARDRPQEACGHHRHVSACKPRGSRKALAQRPRWPVGVPLAGQRRWQCASLRGLMRRKLMLASRHTNRPVCCRGVASCFGNEVEPFYNQVRPCGAQCGRPGHLPTDAVTPSKGGAVAATECCRVHSVNLLPALLGMRGSLLRRLMLPLYARREEPSDRCLWQPSAAPAVRAARCCARRTRHHTTAPRALPFPWSSCWRV